MTDASPCAGHHSHGAVPLNDGFLTIIFLMVAGLATARCKSFPRVFPVQNRYVQPPDNPLILLARSEGFEPPALGIEIRCSIQLSYERIGL
jgi:hypothetical protein